MDPFDFAFSVVATLISIFSFLMAYTRASKSDAVKLENRLTTLEGCKFTEADRKCLQEVEVKISLFWETVKQDFPAFLKRNNTPKIDALLDKAIKSVQNLSPAEITKLLAYLDNEVKNAKKTERPDRAVIAALYRSVIKYETKRFTNAKCK